MSKNLLSATDTAKRFLAYPQVRSNLAQGGLSKNIWMGVQQ